jgi:cbb3-type cytochrome oxidase subunit 3
MATEYLQFAGALVFFLGILIGSYWFVYVPNRGDAGGDDRDRTQQ